MYDQRYGICRGCGAQIIWTRMASGKTMPCDPHLQFFIPDIGKETFVTPDGDMKHGRSFRNLSEIAAELANGEQVKTLRGYTPHWATCPKRDDFKKRSTEK